MQKDTRHILLHIQSVTSREASPGKKYTQTLPTSFDDDNDDDVDALSPVLKMPVSKKPGWVDWKKCPAQAVIMEDLQPGRPLYQRDNITAEEIFPWYKQRPAFADVVFDQFKDRLKDHRLKASKSTCLAIQEQLYFEHDRTLYPRQSHNERGELVFDMHQAKLLLREDIKNNLHKTMYRTPKQLQASRAEYKPFKAIKFAEHI
jgi:hypothetical protein